MFARVVCGCRMKLGKIQNVKMNMENFWDMQLIVYVQCIKMNVRGYGENSFSVFMFVQVFGEN